MESFRSKFHFLLLFAIASLLILIPNSSKKNHIALYIFGDSIFDAGNNNYLKNAIGRANFFPYGETFFKYPTGRASDGRIIPDFIAEYLKLPYLLPYLHPGNYNQYTNGVNFASGGAGVLADTFPGMVLDLQTQVSYLKNVKKQLRQELGDKESEQLLSRAIYLISIGGNDYSSQISTNSTQLHEFIEMVISNLTIALKEIYETGGRKFGFINLHSLGCIPSMRAINKQINNSDKCSEELEILVKLHNNALSKLLKELKKELKGFKYSIFDFYTSANDRINNPSKYGFEEGKKGCCGSGPYNGIPSCGGQGKINEYKLCENPSEYLFFDSFHPTESFNKQLAKLMWTGSHNITEPYNLKELAFDA